MAEAVLQVNFFLKKHFNVTASFHNCNCSTKFTYIDVYSLHSFLFRSRQLLLTRDVEECEGATNQHTLEKSSNMKKVLYFSFCTRYPSIILDSRIVDSNFSQHFKVSTRSITTEEFRNRVLITKGLAQTLHWCSEKLIN